MGRKPKPEGTIRIRIDGTIQEKRGSKWVYIGRDMSNCSPKYLNHKVYNYPPIKISSNMRETLYPGYYITEEGDAYRKPVKGERMTIGENGLVYLKPGRRGHVKYPEKQYDCVNFFLHKGANPNIQNIHSQNDYEKSNGLENFELSDTGPQLFNSDSNIEKEIIDNVILRK